MLILTRRLNESIVIGDIKITVVAIKANRTPGNVRLGIEAPKNVTVHRQEVCERIQRERAAAVATQGRMLKDS